MKKVFLAFVIIFSSAFRGFPQNRNNAEVIFKAFRDAFNFSNPALLSNYLADETYLSIKNGYSDYYSRSQTFYILKDFIRSFSPLKIKLMRKSLNTASPFAEGVLFYFLRGRKKRAKVFLSLEKQKGRFVIAQITID